MSEQQFLNVEGYFSAEEGYAIQFLATGKRVLEMGCWKGRSTSAIASTAHRVLTVDHFKGDGYAGPSDQFHTAVDTLTNLGLREKVAILSMPVLEALDLIDLTAFDLFHYDADHTYEATRAALDKLRDRRQFQPVCVHDFHEGQYPQVVRAVYEFAGATNRGVWVVDSLAVVSQRDLFETYPRREFVRKFSRPGV